MIEQQTTTVWYAPTKNRRYFSKAAAINAEAMALILKRYPVEPFERDTGAGYDIRCDEPVRFEKMYRRLRKLIIKSM